MKKHDKVFIPTYGKDAEFGLLINDGKNKVFPAKEVSNVIVLTEDELNQIYKATIHIVLSEQPEDWDDLYTKFLKQKGLQTKQKLKYG